MSSALQRPRMTRDEFFAWVDRQDDRVKYEFDGYAPVAMVRPALNHARTIGNILAALRERLRGSGCEALAEVALETIDGALRIPDVLVTCTRTSGSARLAEGVVAVFEVLSPESGYTDRIVKLREYAGVPTIRHYVLVERASAALTLFSRDGAEAPWTATPLMADDTLALPAIDVACPVGELFEGVDFATV